ncbi:hypothetical protein RJ55_03634 [Drechmeria coniospora]|nr:hypothetical protein RJ55_03634 [Drechmeria coniospora]
MCSLARNLPAPPPDVTLKKIVLGFGIQNYTCATVGGSADAAGALAMLYDVSALYPGQGHESLSPRGFESLTGWALRNHKVPLNRNKSAAGRVEPTSPGASTTRPFPADAPLRLPGMKALPFLGHHYFDSNGIPVFVLDRGRIKLSATKLAMVDAPKRASKGPEGTGAVSWLFLGSKQGTAAVGAKFVYRVFTAGGVSHGCGKAAGQDSTSYTAMYWFYG